MCKSWRMSQRDPLDKPEPKDEPLDLEDQRVGPVDEPEPYKEPADKLEPEVEALVEVKVEI